MGQSALSFSDIACCQDAFLFWLVEVLVRHSLLSWVIVSNQSQLIFISKRRFELMSLPTGGSVLFNHLETEVFRLVHLLELALDRVSRDIMILVGPSIPLTRVVPGEVLGHR